MAVTMADIAKLRQMTGAGMMDCKGALTEAAGDFNKAIEIIRKKGQAVAAKRNDRQAAEGCALAASDGKFAAALALKCETDFVAQNADFIKLTQSILDLAMVQKPATLDELKNAKIGNSTVAELISDRIGVTGEKMELDFYCTVTGESTVAYIHPGNKLATLVAFNQDADAQVKKEIAMQVAAMNPVALDRASVPAELLEKEREIAKDKARQAGKPENILDRIADGALNKYYSENVLLDQEFIKDNKKTVAAYMDSVSKGLTAIDFNRVNLNQDYFIIYVKKKRVCLTLFFFVIFISLY